MRIFKNKSFHRWALESGLKDSCLIRAVNEINTGLFEADLGGSVYKKRISLGHKGKCGGARILVAYKASDKAIFIYGFSKNKKANITFLERLALKKLARVYFNYDEKTIQYAVKMGELIEVCDEKINS